jgi:hypothetical protein
MDPLCIVKVVHTAAWAFLAGSVLAIPICAVKGRLRLALIFTAFVLAETGLLAVNHMRCPLTNIAAHYTLDRSDNFDIYLPAWLARYNKRIFGTLFVAGEGVLAWSRLRHRQRTRRLRREDAHGFRHA